jgi:hypothetical protein
MARRIGAEYRFLVVALVEEGAASYSPSRMGWGDQAVWPCATEDDANSVANDLADRWAKRVLIFEADLDDDGNKYWKMSNEVGSGA